MEALHHLEDVVAEGPGGAALRYGGLYGPGANDDQVAFVRKRMFPLVGGGHRLHVVGARRRRGERDRPRGGAEDERRRPTSSMTSLHRRPASGCPISRSAPGPNHRGGSQRWLARLLAGEMIVGMMTEGRGFSNAKAKRELGWELRYPSWRQGFTRTGITRSEEFLELRPLLFAIAYRIPGSVAEAEDAVQETWLRYEASPTQPTSAKAFLSAVVTRISIDVLRSARVRAEQYVGTWLPEPLVTDPYEDPERSAELADSVSMAALLLLERLSPLERAVFVLREVFGFGFAEVRWRSGGRRARCPSARGAGAAPHGRRAPSVRGGPQRAG